MILTKLYLENFGLFPGEQEIDLTPEKEKKIILIGGKNGNGKTTLFDAIKLCLYGSQTLEKRSTIKSYDDYLIRKIHHNPQLTSQPSSSSVSLEFKHAHLGKIDDYKIERTWVNQSGKLLKSFKVKKNGEDLEETDAEQWQDFINDLIPPGLSELFFFDGEKIQDLADETEENKQLSDSFKSLLGVDLVEKLKSDLEIYSVKQLKQTDDKDIQKKIRHLEIENKKHEETLDAINQEKAQLKSKIDKLHESIKRQENLIKKEGGLFARKREELNEKKARAEEELSSIEKRIREYCSNILPFLFARDLSKRLKETLLKEKTLRNEIIARENMTKKINKLKKNIVDQTYSNQSLLKREQWKEAAYQILDAVKKNLSPRVNQEKITHNLSSEDRGRLINLIDRANKEAPLRLGLLNKSFHHASKKIRGIDEKLNFAPGDLFIKKYVEKSKELNQELGNFQTKMKFKEEEFKKANFEHEKNRRELQKVLDDLKNKKSLSKRINLVNKVQQALEDYRKKLENEKAKEFSEIFIKSYNQIARKKNVFEKIKMNTQNYSVMLYKVGGKEVHKSQLSAGEKQIYAIAVLWTLTKLSGRPLPFIIDTPLGRLDAEHRENLIKSFFPEASHQLIILSTDTEIDEKALNELKPKITKAYNLKYEQGKTEIDKRYFWNLNEISQQNKN